MEDQYLLLQDEKEDFAIESIRINVYSKERTKIKSAAQKLRKWLQSLTLHITPLGTRSGVMFSNVSG